MKPRKDTMKAFRAAFRSFAERKGMTVFKMRKKKEGKK